MGNIKNMMVARIVYTLSLVFTRETAQAKAQIKHNNSYFTVKTALMQVYSKHKHKLKRKYQIFFFVLWLCFCSHLHIPSENKPLHKHEEIIWSRLANYYRTCSVSSYNYEHFNKIAEAVPVDFSEVVWNYWVLYD